MKWLTEDDHHSVSDRDSDTTNQRVFEDRLYNVCLSHVASALLIPLHLNFCEIYSFADFGFTYIFI